MCELLTDATESDLILAIERNIESAFWELGACLPGATLFDSPKLRRYASDVPHHMANAVVRTKLDGEEADALVREALADYRERGVPMMWFVGPHSRPSNLGEILEAAGCKKMFDTPGMAADFSDLPTEFPLPAGARMEEILDDSGLEEWNSTLAEVFGMPEQATRFFLNAPRQRGLGPDKAFRFFIAYLNDAPVAISSVFLSDGVAGIYCVCTKAEARGLGIGAAITALPMLEARKLGYRYAVLQSTEIGYRVYERLGFRELCRFERYSVTQDSNRGDQTSTS